MKKLAFFFAFLFLSLSVHSQDQAIADSLYQVLEGMDERDTSRLKILIWISQNENVPGKKLAIAEEIKKSAEEHGLAKYLHHAYIQIGQANRMLGNFDVAIDALLTALEHAERSDYSRGIIASYTALADAYSTYGRYDEAIEYYNESIALMSAGDSSLLAVTLLNLGDTYYVIESYDSALFCFEQSKYIYERLGNDPSGLAYNLGNIGLVYAELGELKKAETNLATSIKDLESLGDHYGSCIFLGFMSDIYLDKGYPDGALSFADSSLSISRRFGLKTEMRDNLLRLANIHAEKGTYEEAFKFHKLYLAIKDSISNEEVFSRIENLESAYELSQKQAEVDLLKAQQKNQQAVIVTATAVVFAFAILVIVIFIYYRSKIRVNRVLKRQKVSLERLNETKDKFFSIISHDLRGPVSSLFGVSGLIRHFVKEHNTEQLLEMANHMETSVERLSNLLDNLLNWAMQQQGHFPNVPEKVDVSEMISEIMEMFSNMANGKQIDLRSTISQPVFLWVDKNSVHTIFRNLINNAIKFTPEKGSISASAKTEVDFVEISIADSGIGMPQSKLDRLFNLNGEGATYGTAGEKGLGLGLQLVKEFMSMNNGTISALSKEGGGTTFLVRVPLFDKNEVADKSIASPIQ
ncbi:MAG: tetratricopeptide repeat-containing sensor histidine kinase [Ekhidna sp.]